MNLVEKWRDLGFLTDDLDDDIVRQLVYVLEQAENYIGGIARNNTHKLPFSIFPHTVAKLYYQEEIWVRPEPYKDMEDLLNIMHGVHNGHGAPDYGDADLEQTIVDMSAKTYHEYILENPRPR